MPQRVFIDWSEPFLPQVALRLLALKGVDQIAFDLSGLLVLAPGARAGRLLLHALVEESIERDRPLIPPRIVTPGGLAEALANGPPAIASRQECTFAWLAALREIADDDLAALLHQGPRRHDFLGWMEIGTLLQSLDEEIQGEGLAYENVTKLVEQMGGDSEGRRWRAIARLRTEYEGHLQGAGLIDSDQALRLVWERSSLPKPARVVLSGITELLRVHADLLRRLEGRGGEILSFVQAPQSRAHAFDDLGCLVTGAWVDERIEINDDDLQVVDRPRDQVQSALAAIAGLEGERAAEEIAIGLGEESLGASLQRAAHRAGLDVHLAAGDSLRRSRPAMLLACIADWISDGSYSRLAALARLTDVEALLDERARQESESAGDRLCHLDRSFSEHLYGRLDSESVGIGARFEAIHAIQDAISSLAAPLCGPARPLGGWMPAVIELLCRVYGTVEAAGTTEGERRLADACRVIVDVCSELSRIPPSLQVPCTGAEAARFLLSRLAEMPRPQAIRAGQIEALGWLELRFDPARAVIITGFNEGAIPSSITADAFLPDSLRSRLGLRDNRARYARDLYVLEAVRRSRPRVILICGRRNGLGEPLLPSRFLLAGDPRSLPGRVLRLSSAVAALTWEHPVGSPLPAAASKFVRPQTPRVPIEVPRLRVTQFKVYLECPFRFWLGCVRGLEESGDESDELDPLRFGSLTHDVLRDFGCDDSIRDSVDAQAIESYLESRLAAAVAERFGRRPMASVRVQAARLRNRLKSFARLQASLREDGWRIHACEFKLPETAALDIENHEPMPVSGKIDRIDLHDELGVMLIDYKTSEAGHDPRKTHGPSKAGEWSDLQLPLYHHLYCRFVDGSAGGDRVRLAYITLPKKAEDVDLRLAEWDRDELAGALERAREVVLGIRAGKFEPKDVPPDRDPFAIICQTIGFASGENEGAAAASDES